MAVVTFRLCGSLCSGKAHPGTTNDIVVFDQTQMSTYLWLPTAFSVHSQMPEMTADRFIPLLLYITSKTVYFFCVCVYLYVGEGGLWYQSDSLPLSRPLATGCPFISHRAVRRAGLSIREKTVRAVGIKQDYSIVS